MQERHRRKTLFSKKAQISMEYLAVVGMSLALIMPMLIIFYEQSSSLEEDINAAQIEKIGLEILDSAEETYYLGPPTQKQLTIQLPETIQTINISSEEISFTYTTLQGTNTLSFSSRLPLNMTGTIKTFPGKHQVLIQAQENTIYISENT